MITAKEQVNMSVGKRRPRNMSSVYGHMICDKCITLTQLLKRLIYFISGAGKDGYLCGRTQAQTHTMEKMKYSLDVTLIQNNKSGRKHRKTGKNCGVKDTFSRKKVTFKTLKQEANLTA